MEKSHVESDSEGEIISLSNTKYDVIGVYKQYGIIVLEMNLREE